MAGRGVFVRAGLRYDSGMVKAVIFDMDGVLLDTESVCKVCWNRAAEEFGIEGIGEAYSECVGQNTADTLVVLEKYCGNIVSPKVFYDRTGELFHEIERSEGLSLMPHVVECLGALSSREIRLALASSTRRESVVRQLAAAGIIGYFETITTGDTVAHSKPAPDIYLSALSSLSLGADECIAVEDSPNGVRSATGAGIRCVMVPDQIQPSEEISALAFAVVTSLKEVPNLIN